MRLSPQKWQKDISYLSQTIGVRPPLSEEEYQAAQYVIRRLEALGLVAEEQPFYSPRRVGERLGLHCLLAAIGVFIGLLGAGKSGWRKLLSQALGNGLTLLAYHNLRRVLRGRAPLGEIFWPQRRSQNILARIPPQGEIRSRVVLLAHLDTDVVRFSAQPKVRAFAPYGFASLPLMALLGTLLTTLDAPVWLRRVVLGVMLGQVGLVTADELGDYSAGANDNASGVALLLCLAEELSAQPLRETEVVLAFIGCETVGGSGAAELAAHAGKDWKDAWWVVVDSVGAGELCWVTQHGWSAEPGTRYSSHLEAQALMTRVAAAQPALGVMGRPLRTVDAVGALAAQGCKAVALMGYERSGAAPVNWRQANDTVEHINETTLQRARCFLNAVLKTVDEDSHS